MAAAAPIEVNVSDLPAVRNALAEAAETIARMRELLPVITDVKRLKISPGDRLIVRLDHEPGEYEAHEMLSRLRELLGTDVPVILLCPGMDIEVLESGAEVST